MGTPHFSGDAFQWAQICNVMSKNLQRYYTLKCLIRDLLSNVFVSPKFWLAKGFNLSRRRENETSTNIVWYLYSFRALFVLYEAVLDNKRFYLVVYFLRANRTHFLWSPAPPRFMSKIPKSISIREGDKLSLNISTSGNPAPKITWSLQGGSLRNQSRIKATAESFEIMTVRFEDHGKITCHAENVFGIRVVNVKLIVFGEFASLSVTLDPVRVIF